MKKLIIWALLAATINNPANTLQHSQANYTMMSTVVQCNYHDDSVIVQDDSGELWEFYGVEDWMEGDYCELTFQDTGIEGWRWDDAIVGARYRGYNESWE